MFEVFERVSIRAHGSFLPHLAVFKITRDVLNHSNPHAFRLSKLELHNATTKGVAERGASRTPELRAEGQSRKSLTKAEGPARLVATKGYSTTSAISTFSKVEAKAVLRRGTSDCASIPDTRVAQRLFGEGGPGRAKRLSTGLQVSACPCSVYMKTISGYIDYDPIMDSCLEAFARML